MSQRRMFSPKIVGSDAFLDMPISTQALYFHLGMSADDDGFVNPKRVMRVIGASEDDLKVLIGKRFILPFDSGVVVIKHWLIHNLIRSDLYKETLYTDEKKTLGLNENGGYTELRNGVSQLKEVESPKWLRIRRGDKRTANVPQTALRIGKDRLGKVSKDKIPATDVAPALKVPKKDPKSDETPQTVDEFVASMRASPQKHIRLIGEYADEIKPNFKTKGQWHVFKTRNMRAATEISPFSDDQINSAMAKIQKNIRGPSNPRGFITEWTLETLLKYLTK